MSTTQISPSESLGWRLAAWGSERFPLAVVVVGVFPTFLASLLAGRLAAVGGQQGAPIHLRPLDLAGFVAAIGFFLMLRVFDEHKDYEQDCLAHPDRVLQRGVVTLRELRAVAAVAIASQLAVSIAYDGGAGPVLLAWTVALGWSLLMAAEFFCAAWLVPRLLIYALSHTIVSPLVMWWMFTMGSGQLGWWPVIAGLSAASFAGSLTFEIGRKTFAAEDERPEVDSYSQRYGSRWVGSVCAALVIAGSAGTLAALGSIRSGGEQYAVPGAGWILAVGIPTALACAACATHGREPTASTAKRLGPVCGLANLLGQLTIAAAVLTHGDLTWI